MSQVKRLQLIQKTGKTVFSASFLRQTWQLSEANFKITVKRMVDRGLLLRLAKGLYALSEDYSAYELANTLVAPSYVSLNSALFYHGISFQASERIESVANFGYRRRIDDREYVYYKIKKSLLYDTNGLITKNSVTIATIERATVDCFYLRIAPNLDNIDKLNSARLEALVGKYPSWVKKQVKSVL